MGVTVYVDVLEAEAALALLTQVRKPQNGTGDERGEGAGRGFGPACAGAGCGGPVFVEDVDVCGSAKEDEFEHE